MAVPILNPREFIRRTPNALCTKTGHTQTTQTAKREKETEKERKDTLYAALSFKILSALHLHWYITHVLVSNARLQLKHGSHKTGENIT